MLHRPCSATSYTPNFIFPFIQLAGFPSYGGRDRGGGICVSLVYEDYSVLSFPCLSLLFAPHSILSHSHIQLTFLLSSTNGHHLFLFSHYKYELSLCHFYAFAEPPVHHSSPSFVRCTLSQQKASCGSAEVHLHHRNPGNTFHNFCHSQRSILITSCNLFKFFCHISQLADPRRASRTLSPI